MAAAISAGPEVFKLLLENGAQVTGQGRFRLDCSTHFGPHRGKLTRRSSECCWIAAREVAARDEKGATPLHHAARHSGPEVVRIMLERGADATARDDNLKTPLHFAMTDGYSAPTDYSADPEVVRLLLENGAEVNAADEHGNTPLISVSSDPRPEVTELLLAEGADATARNDFGTTPLHGAAGAGVTATVALLLEHGTDVNAPNDTLQTPLHRGGGPAIRITLPRHRRPIAGRRSGHQRSGPGGRYPAAPGGKGK